MILVGTVWGVLSTVALLAACVEPVIRRNKSLKAFKQGQKNVPH